MKEIIIGICIAVSMILLYMQYLELVPDVISAYGFKGKRILIVCFWMIPLFPMVLLFVVTFMIGLYLAITSYGLYLGYNKDHKE